MGRIQGHLRGETALPTYEYRCPQGHEFEKFQRMTEPPVAACPECGEDAERILSGGAGLLFKGEGFYITDYRSESYRKAAEKEKGAKPDGGSGKGEPSGGKGEPSGGKSEPSGGQGKSGTGKGDGA
jgi:putative FmdB family regulatory protein